MKEQSEIERMIKNFIHDAVICPNCKKQSDVDFEYVKVEDLLPSLKPAIRKREIEIAEKAIELAREQDYRGDFLKGKQTILSALGLTEGTEGEDK